MATIEEQQSAQYQSLFRASKPRRVRIKAFTQITLGAFPIAAIILMYFGVVEILNRGQPGPHLSPIMVVVFNFLFPAILLVVSGMTFCTARRDRDLMREGELALGVVTHQKLVEVRGGRGGRRTKSRVRYRFKDASGQLYQGTGTDYSRRLRVEMTVPVFYDPKDPERNVAICTATCELEDG